MSTILDHLYREYCRARLAEMRKQLLLSVSDGEIPATNCDVSNPDGPDDRDETATKEPSHPAVGASDSVASVGESARSPHTSEGSQPT